VVHRDAEGDTEVLEVTLPALVTAQQGLNEPRYPSVPGIMKAKRKTIARVTPAAPVAPATEVTTVFQAQQNRRNTMIKGSPAEQAQQLVQLLRGEAKVV